MEETPKDLPDSPAASEPPAAPPRPTPEQEREFQWVFKRRLWLLRLSSFAVIPIVVMLKSNTWEYWVAVGLVVALMILLGRKLRCPACNARYAGDFPYCGDCGFTLAPRNIRPRLRISDTGFGTQFGGQLAKLSRRRATTDYLAAAAMLFPLAAMAILYFDVFEFNVWVGTAILVASYLGLLVFLRPVRVQCPACDGKFWMPQVHVCPYCCSVLANPAENLRAMQYKLTLPNRLAGFVSIGLTVVGFLCIYLFAPELGYVAQEQTIFSYGNGLSVAITAGNEKAVRRLLEHGADPNRETRFGGMPLVEAASRNNPAIIRSLLEHGADPNLPIRNGISTPFIEGADYGKLEAVQLMLAHGAKVNLLTPSGKSALTMASWMGRTDIVKLLLDNHADPNLGEGCASSLRMAATTGKHEEIIRMLLDAGAKVNGLDGCKVTPLMEAADAGKVESVDLLLAAGSRLDAPWVPAECKEVDTPEGKGKDCGCEGSIYGKSPLRIAREGGHDEIVKILEAAGAKE